MKKRLLSLALCACLAISAVVGFTGTKARRGANPILPQCNLPADLFDQ